MTAEPLLVLPHRAPLVPGRLVERYNRFLADVQLDDGRLVTAHCVNTGRMEGLTSPGLRVWLAHQPGEGRALAWSWEITELGSVMVGSNTSLPNMFVGELLKRHLLVGFLWDELKAEQKYGENSRIDYWLRKGRREHFIEVKNCHLTYPDGRGYFPDSVSERATKHLEELIHVVEQGHRASVVFTAQRLDTKAVRPSDVHDSEFAAAARRAAEAGVRFRAVVVEPTPEAYIIHRVIPVDLKPYATDRPARWREEGRALGPAWATRKRADTA